MSHACPGGVAVPGLNGPCSILELEGKQVESGVAGEVVWFTVLLRYNRHTINCTESVHMGIEKL